MSVRLQRGVWSPGFSPNRLTLRAESVPIPAHLTVRGIILNHDRPLRRK